MTRMAFSLDFNVFKGRMLSVFTQFAAEVLRVDDVDMRDLSLNKLNHRLLKESFDGNIGEAFEIYILMHSLADSIKEAGVYLERDQFTPEQSKAFDFIRQHMGRIEIADNGKLQRVYFPIRPVCGWISQGARKSLMNDVDRDSQATKVTGLMDAVPDLIDEMNHNEELSRAWLQITPARLMAGKDFSTVVGLLINFIYLCFAERRYHYRDMDVAEWVVDTIEQLGLIQGASSGILIFFYAINKKRLITQRKWREFVEGNKGSEKLQNNDRLDVAEMSFEMTHLILMRDGPEAAEFNLGDELDFGNWYTWSEYQLFNIYFFVQDPAF